jgi:hypothetical protein
MTRRHRPARGDVAGHARTCRQLRRPNPSLAAEYGGLACRIERALLSLGDIARVHVYRWGDNVAHFHVWFIPRPLGMLHAQREMLMLWEDQLPPATEDNIAAAGARVGAAMTADNENCLDLSGRAPETIGRQ